MSRKTILDHRVNGVNRVNGIYAIATVDVRTKGFTHSLTVEMALLGESIS